MTHREFQKTIWEYYKKNRRDFPWRIPNKGLTPYHILVSEIMLQQTQADRVVSKYESFIKKFPDFKSLAEAPLQEVLKEWKGLGYNRRGLNLKRLAVEIMEKHNGELPRDPEALLELPGIGPGTVGSILAFAFNLPHPFIETNIRSVYIHFFKKTHDKEIIALAGKTMDKENPREWHYALMDYGVMLKKLHKNPSRKSVHYKKQTAFKGSTRELRAQVLQCIVEQPNSVKELSRILKKDGEVLARLVDDLTHEGFIVPRSGVYYIV